LSFTLGVWVWMLLVCTAAILSKFREQRCAEWT